MIWVYINSVEHESSKVLTILYHEAALKPWKCSEMQKVTLISLDKH